MKELLLETECDSSTTRILKLFCASTGELFIFFFGVCTVCRVWADCILAHKRGSRTRDIIPRLFAASFRLRSDLQPWLETSPIYYPFYCPMPGADEC